MVIGFSQIFWEAGMAKALIQRQTNLDQACNAAFWINAILGVVISLLLLLLAASIATLIFHDARVTAVLQVMTLQILLGATASVHTALLQKEMHFRQLFWVRFISVSAPALASIPLAWIGMGYWALVAGTLAGQSAQVVMLWRAGSWRPKLAIDFVVAKEMMRFGGWVSATGILVWFYAWADSLIVGMYLGSYELGLYRTGNHLVIMLFAIVFGPVIPVFYSHLSRMTQDTPRIAQTLEKAIKVVALLSIPISISIFALAESLEATLFGAQWKGIGFIIGAMALMHGLSWLVALNGEAYRAMGKPSLETIVTGSMLAVYLVTYVVSIRSGLEYFVWARVALAALAFAFHLLVARLIISIALRPLFQTIALTTAISMLVAFLVHVLLTEHLPSDWLKVLVSGPTTLAILMIVLGTLERHGAVRDILTLARNRPV
jgi:O-antigen/teichoic acid export membrane protein